MRLTVRLLLIPFLLLACGASAQTAREVWRDVNETAVLAGKKIAGSKRTVTPVGGRTLRVEPTVLRKALAKAPLEFSGAAPLEFSLPLPDGTFARFAVEESPIMAPKLAAKYPAMKTYVARGIDHPTWTARLDRTPQGFHAMILAEDGVTFFIDPYWRDDARVCIAYRKRDYVNPAKDMACLAVDRIAALAAPKGETLLMRPTGTMLRTYRLAVGCTGEYAAAAGGGTVSGALGAILTTINRVTGIYERDFAIRLKLVNNEDQIIFTDATTDGYTNTNAIALENENQVKLDAVIGDTNYDIGHVFSTGGGGIADLARVGVAGRKAKGVSGTAAPSGDPYAVNFVAHEMGHQFGANHSFNGTTGSCAGSQRIAGSAYEPGSGSTIMAYAGICAGQNLAANSEAYFHTKSYDEIDSYTSSLPATVGTATSTGNSAPVVGAIAASTIPIGTPFALTASGTDANAGDVLTYCWEEFDLGALQDPTLDPRDNGASPIFRSYPPTANPTRLFPSLTYILNNASVPPATVGSFASGEILPATNRTMTFRVTVRDNHAGGGGSDYGSTTVTSTTAAGPFAITSHNTPQTIAAGSSQTITWSVANTTAAPVNCANVKITLSTDGGVTFPFDLMPTTPNTGSAMVTIPPGASAATTQGRIKIKAVGNIFFDISDANLTITAANAAPALTMTGSVTVQRGTPTATMATVATVTDPNTPLTATVSNVPPDAAVTAAVSGGNVIVSAQANGALTTTNTSRTYPLTLTVADFLGATTSGTFNLVVQPNPAPTLGTYANQNLAIGSGVTVTPSAPPADANNNLGAAPCTVTPVVLAGAGTLSVNQATGAVTVTTTGATTPGTYTVRVTAQDTSGAAVVQSFTLKVAPPNPTPAASVASAPTAENCAPANSAVDPGEMVTVNFTLANNGAAATTNLVATLQNVGGVAPVTASQNYGAIAAFGGTVTRAFSFTASGTCGGTITPTFQLQDGAVNYGSVSFTIRLGVFQPVTGSVEQFDSVTAPALPAGWTTTGPAPRWKTNTLSSDTLPNNVFVTPTSTVSDTILDSPNIAIVSQTAQISFRHRWSLEADVNGFFDGGVLEVSIGGGAFTDILAAGGSFVAGGYNGTLSAGFQNPLAGRPAWSGYADNGYTTTTVNLPASAAGQSIRLRWRLGCDNSGTDVGLPWRVDTITLTDGPYACCSGGPVFTSALPPNGTVGVAYTHTFTASGTPAPTFSITSGTLPAGIALGGAVLSGTPAAPGIYTGLTATASNGTLPNGTQNFSLLIANTYQNFITPFGFNAANADPAADPDGDGIKNVNEYGLNLLPNVPNRTGLPATTIKNYAGTNYLSITFTRMTTATDLTYTVQVSPDLATWTDVATSVAGAVTTGAGFVAETGTVPALTVEVRDTVVATPGTKRFIRLKIVK